MEGRARCRRGGRDRWKCCPGHLRGGEPERRGLCPQWDSGSESGHSGSGGQHRVGACKTARFHYLIQGQDSSESPEGPDALVFTITSWNDRGKKGKILHVHSIVSSFPKYKKSLINTLLRTGVRNTFTSHLPSFYTFLNCTLDTAFLPTDC